jgi:hypothetical protein
MLACLRRATLLLAASAVFGAAWITMTVLAVDHGRNERLHSRSPVVTTTSDAIAWYAETADLVAGRQFSVICLQPLDSGGAPPPGLPRWPEAGEAWLSPALVLADSDGAVRERYGRFAGVIGRVGLADPSELFVYFRPAAPAARTGDRWVAVSGWATARPFPWISEAHRSSPWLTVGLLWLFIGWPGLWAAAMAGSMSLLLGDLAGSTPSIIARRLISELSWTAVGATMAGCVAWWLTRIVPGRPPLGLGLDAHDAAATVRWIPFLAAGAALATTVTVIVAACAVRGRRFHVAWTSAHVADVAGKILSAGLVVAIWGAVGGPLSIWVFGVALVAGLAAVPFVGLRWAHRTVRPLRERRTEEASGSVTAAVGWHRPAAGRLVAFTFALGALLTSGTVIHVVLTQSDANVASAERIRDEVGYSVIQINAASTADQKDRFADLTGPQHLLRIVAHSGSTTLTGTCDALAQLGTMRRCPIGTVPAADVFASYSFFGHSLATLGLLAGGRPASVSTDKTVGTVRALLVLNEDGEAGYRRIARNAYAVLSLPSVSLPGQEWLGSLSRADETAQKLNLLWLAGICCTICAGMLGMAAVLVAGTRSVVFGRGRSGLLVALAAVYLPTNAFALVAGLAVHGAQGSGRLPMTLYSGAFVCTLLLGCVVCMVAPRSAQSPRNGS